MFMALWRIIVRSLDGQIILKNNQVVLQEACKEGLTSGSLLVHYDLNRTLRLACDASSYYLGAVLSHVMEDG